MFVLQFSGNLTKDPYKKVLPSGAEVVTLAIAVNVREHNGERSTYYIDADAYGRIGDTAMKYLSKGRKVYIIAKVTKLKAGRDEGRVFINATILEMEMVSSYGGSGDDESDHMKQMYAPAQQSPVEPPKAQEVPTPSDLPWDVGASEKEPDLPF